MKVAIISDVHNNVTNLKKVLGYCAKEEIINLICCGDLASDETLEFLADNFSGQVYYAFGNMDNDQLRKYESAGEYKNIKMFKDFGEAELAGKKVAFVHFPQVAKLLAGSGDYDYVFYGHTHKPWTEKIGNREILNPGNVAGDLYPPTFAVWDTANNKFELIRIHSL